MNQSAPSTIRRTTPLISNWSVSLTLDVRVLRVHGFEDHAPFAEQVLFHEHTPIDRRHDDISGAGLYDAVDQDPVTVLDPRRH